MRVLAIDTDPGIDDALALMLALRSPEWRVELITTVAGNVPVDQGTANLRRLLRLIRPATPPAVARGAGGPLRRRLTTAQYIHGDDGLGGLTKVHRRNGQPTFPLSEDTPVERGADRKLVELARRHRARLTIVALGPLTNIARAVQRSPRDMRRIGGLIVMGGAIESPGNVTPAAEFNIFVDPHAASVVFNARLPTVLVPLDVTHQVRLTLETLKKRLRGSRTDLARAVRVMTADLLAGRYRSDGTPMHDPLAIAAAIDRSLIGTEPMAVLVETRGVHTLGMTMTDRRPGREALTAAPTIEVATSVRAREALDLFCRRVLDPERNAAGSKTAPRRGKRVIVVGSANMDFSVRVPHLPAPGETVIGRSLGIHFGGKGANQAVAARRAGADVDLVAMLGRDPLGASYLAHLEAERIETQQIELSGREPSGAALIAVAPRGQNQISVAPGANMALGVEKMAGLAEIVDDAAVLVVQLEIPLRSVEHALRVARRRRLLTLLNPAPAAPLPERMQKLVDVLVLNEVEAAMLTGRPIATLRDARGAVRALHDAGFSRVALTLGRRGVMWTDGAGSGHQPGRPVKALDATGAGDTFVGYLACALAERRPFADAVSSANAAAALSVARTGAQTGIPRRSEVQKYLGGATGDLGHHPQIPGGGS